MLPLCAMMYVNNLSDRITESLAVTIRRLICSYLSAIRRSWSISEKHQLDDGWANSSSLPSQTIESQMKSAYPRLAYLDWPVSVTAGLIVKVLRLVSSMWNGQLNVRI